MKKEHSTPLMRQYSKIKADFPDMILLYRMGDFYETFNEDAQTIARVLDITLTSRANGKASKVPLAGFPHHALEQYMSKLLSAGFKVAICEQVEDPKKAKGLVKREVTEVISPGTAVGGSLSKETNYLLSIFQGNGEIGFGLLDVSTGEMKVGQCSSGKFPEMICGLNIAEILISETQIKIMPQSLRNFSGLVSDLPEWAFGFEQALEDLLRQFQVKSLKSFGCANLPLAISAAGAALHYTKKIQKRRMDHLVSLNTMSLKNWMVLDQDTLRNLEIFQPIRSDQKNATLWNVLNQTVTPLGARRLQNWMLKPLLDVKEIAKRQRLVRSFFENSDLCNEITDGLAGIADIERIIGKISAGRGNARDLVALREGFLRGENVFQILKKQEKFKGFLRSLPDISDLKNLLISAMTNSPPVQINEGGMIQNGYNQELDSLHALQQGGRQWMMEYQAKLRKELDISTLKVGYNNVFGYYLEVTKRHADKMPDSFARKQTLVNAERYISSELKEHEDRLLAAEEQVNGLELRLFLEIRDKMIQSARKIQQFAQLLGKIDTLSTFARLAREKEFVCPDVNDSSVLQIENGRHIMVESLLPAGDQFIENDIYLNPETHQLALVTGPNMSGKSTYLRQVGLIVLMAQIGSFVPAKKAKIGVVDWLFTRVGASDNLAGGESTFFVEMSETATILNNATPKSLILLDEIGRGTSTYDGLSIAWAVTEALHNNPKIAARTLFATHYHELTELANRLPRIFNLNIAIKEQGDQIIFLRKIVPGSCNKSYGIHVAKMSGFPNSVVARANEILEQVSHHQAVSVKSEGSSSELQLTLFSPEEHHLREEIMNTKIEELTPLEALQRLYRLQKKLKENS